MSPDLPPSPRHSHVRHLSSTVASSNRSYDVDDQLTAHGLALRQSAEPDRNASVSREGHPLERFSPSGYLPWLTSLLSKLPSSIEQYIVAAIRRWKQIWSAVLAKVMTGGDSHTSILPRDRASHRRPSYPPSGIEDPGGYRPVHPTEEDLPVHELGLDEGEQGVWGSWTGDMEPPPQRRRSVWVVRPSDGPDGVVNVCARYRAKDDRERIEIVL